MANRSLTVLKRPCHCCAKQRERENAASKESCDLLLHGAPPGRIKVGRGKYASLGDASVAIDRSKFKAVNARDRNFTQTKMQRRLEQIDESIKRYLSQLDTADRQGPTVPEAKFTRLNEKIATLRQEMQRLNALNTQMMQTEDKQISLTGPDARSMATSGRGSGIVGYRNAHRRPPRDRSKPCYGLWRRIR